MTSYLNNLTQYNIREDSICIPTNVNTFKQLSGEYKFQIPCTSPDVSVIEKVITSTEIISTHLIKTPQGTSADGQTLTGYKAVTVGNLKVTVQYDSFNSEGGLNVVNYLIPFSVPIVVPSFYSEYSNVFSSVDIEYLDVELIDPRNLYISVAMLVAVEV
ncbi:hypothetical protein QOZ83_16335 [Romboutsia sedimentorum]|uniref:hypothetical protein n=1 Tax=Romboutsia sedimentorum TaxID=1368474 RepID=UPI0024DEE08C|nr:hypothetical protein [Romboutsia sedimentorum]MDK2587413.1 hypothetical protein [Romboutsia sedimentorum]